MKATREYKIRKANANETDAILACLRSAFETYRAEYTPAAFADTVLDSETIKSRMRDMSVLVAVSEDMVVGTIGCGVNGEEGHLRGMAVYPDWQGTELASALLSAAENELRRSKCTFVTLDTTKPLKRAIRFYESTASRPPAGSPISSECSCTNTPSPWQIITVLVARNETGAERRSA
jgi:ribosomal protein S18 acetylase RimI-like enzyme